MERHNPLRYRSTSTRTQSETRRQLVAEIAPLLTEGDRTEVRTEPAFWFTPPTVNVRQPRRWKQFLITLLVIFPSTNGACGDRHAAAVA